MSTPQWEYKVEVSAPPGTPDVPPRKAFLNRETNMLEQEPEEEYRERVRNWKPPMTLTDTLNTYAADGWRAITVSIQLGTDQWTRPYWVVVFERLLS